jgi:anti-sigma B factor antagonist
VGFLPHCPRHPFTATAGSWPQPTFEGLREEKPWSRRLVARDGHLGSVGERVRWDQVGPVVLRHAPIRSARPDGPRAAVGLSRLPVRNRALSRYEPPEGKPSVSKARSSSFCQTEEEPTTVEATFDMPEDSGNSVSIVSATGEIDIATAPSLRQRLEATIDQGSDVVVVDLLGVTFMDSTALGVLVGALKRCRQAGGAMRIVLSDPRVLKVFEITGLTELFSIFPTIDQAVLG